MSVSPQRGEARWQEVPEQVNADTFPWHAHTAAGLDRWGEKRGEGKKRGKTVADMLWLDESERNQWASFFRLDGSYDWPHKGSLLPYPITSYNFGFVLCLSCHNTKMTGQHETEHSSLNKAYFHIPAFFFLPFVLSMLLFMLSGVHHCQLSTGSVCKRAEPFHKLVNSVSKQKVTAIYWTGPERCQLWILQTSSPWARSARRSYGNKTLFLSGGLLMLHCNMYFSH